jgi:GNAT superfamily N-acetyltransferase
MSHRRRGQAETVELLDGSAVTVRRLDKRDIEAVTELHSQLTDQEQYMRFFIVHPVSIKELTEKLVACDRCHYALGAFDSGRLIGVANYVAASNQDVAEVAVAVAHHDHLRGVATVLLRRLAEVAAGHGIRRFTADVLATNFALLNVLSDAGWRHTTRFDGSVLNIQMDLAELVDQTAGQSA